MIYGHIYKRFEKPSFLPWIGDARQVYKNVKIGGGKVKKSAFSDDVKHAAMLLQSFEQMQDYALEEDFIEASIYFQKGCQKLLDGYIRLNRIDARSEQQLLDQKKTELGTIGRAMGNVGKLISERAKAGKEAMLKLQ